MKKALSIFVLSLLCIAFSSQLAAAFADDLVIEDNGSITLLVTSDVLGIKIIAANNPAKQSAPQSQKSKPASNPAPSRAVPLTAPKTESTVKINPPLNNDKKVQVIITTPQVNPQVPAPAVGQTSQTQAGTIQQKAQATPFPTPAIPANVITKTVDEVIAQDTNGEPVLSIKSEKANQLTIEQGSTQVTTSLPLQMNSLTHVLSVSSPKQPTINVLPAQALQGVVDKGFLDKEASSQIKINLSQDASGVNYTVDSKKEGKLFGILPVSSPVQVKLSAQTGKVVGASQSLIFSLFGGLIRR